MLEDQNCSAGEQVSPKTSCSRAETSAFVCVYPPLLKTTRTEHDRVYPGITDLLEGRPD